MPDEQVTHAQEHNQEQNPESKATTSDEVRGPSSRWVRQLRNTTGATDEFDACVLESKPRTRLNPWVLEPTLR